MCSAKILSHYGAEKKHQKKKTSQFSLYFGLTSFLSWCIANFGTSSTPRGSVEPISPRDGPFPVTVWLSWFFARLIGLKTLCSSVVSMKTSAARLPEAFLTNCHTYSTLPLNFSHCSLRLDCSSVWWCIQAHFYRPVNSVKEDGVVQLPFKPALRLRLFSHGLRARSFLSNLSSNYFSCRVSLKPEGLGF